MAAKKLSEFSAVSSIDGADIILPILVGGVNRTLELNKLFDGFKAVLETDGGSGTTEGIRNRGVYANDAGVSLLSIGTDDGLIRRTTNTYNQYTTTTLGSVVEFTFSDGVKAPAYRFGAIASSQITGFHIPYESDVPFDVYIEAQNDSENGFDYLYVTNLPDRDAYVNRGPLLMSLDNTNTIQKRTFTVPAGKGDLFFRYQKDNSGTQNTDTTYIRKLRIGLPKFSSMYVNGDMVLFEGKLFMYAGAQPTQQSPADNLGWVSLAGEEAPAPTGVQNRGPWIVTETYHNGSIVSYGGKNYLWTSVSGTTGTPGSDGGWFPLFQS